MERSAISGILSLVHPLCTNSFVQRNDLLSVFSRGIRVPFLQIAIDGIRCLLPFSCVGSLANLIQQGRQPLVRIDSPRRSVRLWIGVYPDSREILSQSRFHGFSSAGVQRISPRAENFVHHRRHLLSGRINFRLPRLRRMLFAAGVAFAATGMPAAGTCTLQDGNRRPGNVHRNVSPCRRGLCSSHHLCFRLKLQAARKPCPEPFLIVRVMRIERRSCGCLGEKGNNDAPDGRKPVPQRAASFSVRSDLWWYV
jgi:hypothetical protein